eukprot:7381020-Prymnesium_polylepis.2
MKDEALAMYQPLAERRLGCARGDEHHGRAASDGAQRSNCHSRERVGQLKVIEDLCEQHKVKVAVCTLVQQAQHAQQAGERGRMNAAPGRGKYTGSWQCAIHNLLQTVCGGRVVKLETRDVKTRSQAFEVAAVSRVPNCLKNRDVCLVEPEAPFVEEWLQLHLARRQRPAERRANRKGAVSAD